MRVYHLLPAKWALDNLKRRRLKVAKFADLNDPFELLAVELSNSVARRQFKTWRKLTMENYGVLCFSKKWDNPVLWSHYAEKHEGICLGFDMADNLLQPVQYMDKRIPLDTLVRGTAKVPAEPGPLFRLKFRDWQYEDEVRRVLPLAETLKDGANFFWPFSGNGELELREVVAGARCAVDDNCLKETLGDLADRVKLIQARPAFKSFGVVTQQRGFKGVRRLCEAIRAGRVSEVRRDSGEWLFVDLGFARETASCGFLHGDGTAEALTFAAVRERVTRAAAIAAGPLNLLLEAPLSVAFTKDGNPTGRSMEKRLEGTRFWYVGLGCAVLTAATYLLRAVASAEVRREIRLFEGFVSFKPKAARSSHTDDVTHLRDVVWHPENYPGAITPPERLGLGPTDVVSSAFAVLGLDMGIPPVITVMADHLAPPTSRSHHPERARRS